MKLHEALEAFKSGQKIDFRQNSCCPWEENPFRKRDKLIDGGQMSVLTLEGALARDAEFRVRPPKPTRVDAMVAQGSIFTHQGPAATLAKDAVRAALKDVREYLNQNVVGTAFIDRIETEFCGVPEVKATPKKIEVGSRWKVYDSPAVPDGFFATVKDPHFDDGLCKFEDKPYGGWLHYRFLTAGMDRKDWEVLQPRFEYVGEAGR